MFKISGLGFRFFPCSSNLFRFFPCSSPLSPAGFEMKPVPPAGFDMRPLMESLFSGSAFRPAADVDYDAAAPGQPPVTLLEWWLATVEGDDQKIAVAGTFKRNQTLYELCPAPIAKRRSPNILESEDGTTLLISGSLDISRSLGNGYSNTVCEHFMVGFPRWWQSCNLRYPKRKNSDTGCQPCSSNTNNYGVEHFASYRPSFISKHPDGLKSSSHNDSVFPKSSHLSNGAPRFEENTCDGNIATNENAAAASGGDIPTNEDAAASNDGNERYTAASKEVNTLEIVLTASSERGHDHIATDVSLTSTVQCTDNAVSGAIDSTPATACRPAKETIFPHEKRQSATRSYWTRSTVACEKHASMGGWSHTLSPTCSATPGLLAGSPSNERGHDDIATDVSLAPTVQCTNNAVSEALYSTPTTELKTAPVACLKNQGSLGGNQHIASNKKIDLCLGKEPVSRPKKPHEKRKSATRAHETRSPESQVLWSPLTRSKAASLSISTPEALNLKRTRSGRVIVPHLVEGCQSIVYGRDGSITGVIGLDSPAMPKRNESVMYGKTYERRGRHGG